MNFGIIGYGTIAKTHAQVIESLPDAKLTAIATRTPEKARTAGEEHKLIMGIYESSRRNEWVSIN